MQLYIVEFLKIFSVYNYFLFSAAFIFQRNNFNFVLLCDRITEYQSFQRYNTDKEKLYERSFKEMFNMSVVTITQDNFENEVMKSTVPVLIDFWASWCGPCRMLSPVIEEIADETTDKKICKVNVDEQPELARKFGVMSIPTLVVMNKGEIVKKSLGAQPKNSVLSMFNV